MSAKHTPIVLPILEKAFLVPQAALLDNQQAPKFVDQDIREATRTKLLDRLPTNAPELATVQYEWMT